MTNLELREEKTVVIAKSLGEMSPARASFKVLSNKLFLI